MEIFKIKQEKNDRYKEVQYKYKIYEHISISSTIIKVNKSSKTQTKITT